MLAALVAPGAELPVPQPPSPTCRHRARSRPRLVAVAASPGSRDELVAAIRVWEGEALEQAPLLFKATVALGTAMLAGAGLLILGIAG